MIKPVTNCQRKQSALDASIVPLDKLDLIFGRRKHVSPYRELLEQLLDSPRNSALMVRNVGARYSLRKQARALGYEALFAEYEGSLYVKIAGVVNPEAAATKKQRPSVGLKFVLSALAKTPKTAAEMARILKSDTASCEAVLNKLVESGAVERDDGLGTSAIYRVVSKAKRVA
jgi:hypothetical protein